MDTRSTLDRLRDKLFTPLVVRAIMLCSAQTRARYNVAILRHIGAPVPDRILRTANLARKAGQ